jgi:hypothetical protein
MKQRVLAHASQGHKAPTIAKELQKENLKYLRVGMHKFRCDLKTGGEKGQGDLRR